MAAKSKGAEDIGVSRKRSSQHVGYLEVGNIQVPFRLTKLDVLIDPITGLSKGLSVKLVCALAELNIFIHNDSQLACFAPAVGSPWLSARAASEFCSALAVAEAEAGELKLAQTNLQNALRICGYVLLPASGSPSQPAHSLHGERMQGTHKFLQADCKQMAGCNLLLVLSCCNAASHSLVTQSQLGNLLTEAKHSLAAGSYQQALALCTCRRLAHAAAGGASVPPCFGRVREALRCTGAADVGGRNGASQLLAAAGTAGVGRAAFPALSRTLRDPHGPPRPCHRRCPQQYCWSISNTGTLPRSRACL